jgi:hypothetical protein
MSKRVELDGVVFRVVEKPGYTIIYRRRGTGPFTDSPVWSSRKDKLKVGSTYARVLAVADAR